MKEKRTITREEFTLEILELTHKFKHILFHKASNIYIEDPSKMLPSMFVRYKRICSVFKSIGITIKDVKYLNDLEFIDQYKDYDFNEELLSSIENYLEDFYTVEDVKTENLKLTIKNIMQFRKNYISVFQDFFGGVRFGGRIRIEKLLSKGFIAESILKHQESIDSMDRIITLLLFPNVKEFDVSLLIEKYGFPTEDYTALEYEEKNDYW